MGTHKVDVRDGSNKCITRPHPQAVTCLGLPGPTCYTPLRSTPHFMATVGGCVFSFSPQIFTELLRIPGPVLGTMGEE